MAEWLRYCNVKLIHLTAEWFLTCTCRFST